MSLRWGALVPRTIAAQVAALLIVSVLALHAVLTTFFFLGGIRGGPPREDAARLAGLVRLVDATPAAERSVLLERLARADPRLMLGPHAGPLPPGAPRPEPLADALGPGFSVYAAPRAGSAPLPPGEGRPLVVRLGDGSLISLEPGRPPPRGGWFPFIATLAFLGISLTLLGVWAVHAVTAPLRAFAAAAESFGEGSAPVFLPEQGATEVRRASAAFNRMQSRIARLLDDRTRMLAAVSHDLRTPITRLRLRAEFVEDETLRERIVAELDEMSARVQAALQHLRGGRTGERATLVDLPSLLATVSDHFTDLGRDVPYEGPERFNFRGRPSELGRAVQNLAENAVRCAPSVRISLETGTPGWIAIVVADDGPGIPEEDRARLMEPFVRGDEARGTDTGEGFGLGLTVARSIAEAHGGRLVLGDARPHGLVARIELPTTPG